MRARMAPMSLSIRLRRLTRSKPFTAIAVAADREFLAINWMRQGMHDTPTMRLALRSACQT